MKGVVKLRDLPQRSSLTTARSSSAIGAPNKNSIDR